MQFTNEFRVPADVDTTLATLTDLAQVAACVPGARLTTVDDGVHEGRLQVRLGPIRTALGGTASFTEVDARAGRASMMVSGRRPGGGVPVRADLTTSLRPDGAGTIVEVGTRLGISGRRARFMGGVAAEVCERVINQFAQRLEVLLRTGRGPESLTTADATGLCTGKGRAHAVRGADDSLDLWLVGGAAVSRRVVPVVASAAVVAGLLVWRRRR